MEMKTGMNWRKKIGAMITASLLAGVLPSQTHALPANPHAERNIESITTNDNIMEIVGNGNSFIKWHDFSIGAGGIVRSCVL